MERPFRVPGYPFVPLLFVLAAAAPRRQHARHEPARVLDRPRLHRARHPALFLHARRQAAAQRGSRLTLGPDTPLAGRPRARPSRPRASPGRSPRRHPPRRPTTGAAIARARGLHRSADGGRRRCPPFPSPSSTATARSGRRASGSPIRRPKRPGRRRRPSTASARSPSSSPTSRSCSSSSGASSTSTSPIQTILPDFRPKDPFGPFLTLRELMSHRAGLVREPPVGNYFDPTEPSLAATVASLNDTELVYPPGTHTKYSNAGIAVVGYVLERRSGEPFAKYLQHAVLDPMAMTSSAFAPDPALRAPAREGDDVGLRRPELPRADLRARHGARRQPLRDRRGPRPVPLGALRGGPGPRGRVLRRETLEADVDAAVRRAGREDRVRDRLSRRRARRPPLRRARRRDLRLRHVARRAAGREARRGRRHERGCRERGDRTRSSARRCGSCSPRARARRFRTSPTTEPVPPELARSTRGHLRRGRDGADRSRSERGGELSMLSRSGGEQQRLRQLRRRPRDRRPARLWNVGRLRPDARPPRRRVARPRSRACHPPPPSAAWKELLGEYGWDHNILYVLERDGRLDGADRVVRVRPADGGLPRTSSASPTRPLPGRDADVRARRRGPRHRGARRRRPLPAPRRRHGGGRDLPDPAASARSTELRAEALAATPPTQAPDLLAARPRRARAARSDDPPRHPLRDVEQLPRRAALLAAARLPAAPGGRGARPRAPEARGRAATGC